MDLRNALEKGYRLYLHKKDGSASCFTICGEIGRGASCIVYSASYETNSGDVKLVRIKECFPHRAKLTRRPDGSLTAAEEDEELFNREKEQLIQSFSEGNRLFYGSGMSACFVNTLDVYRDNNTVYVVSAYSSEQTLAHRRPDTLRECAALIRNTALILKRIHDCGFLYLDVKPDNILTVEGMADRVQLFDFDSLFPSGGRAGETNLRISYTKGFAATELQLGRTDRLGPYTDVYGIGALFFYLLFGRAPSAMDCLENACYDFSQSALFTHEYCDRLYSGLTEFFHRSLAGFYRDRYPDMARAIAALEGIEKSSDVTAPYLISSVVLPPACFVGRAAELEVIAAWWKNEREPVLTVSGMGGIGKSSLVRAFIAGHRSEIDSVVYFSSEKSLKEHLISDAELCINTVTRLTEETAEDYLDRKLAVLRRITARSRVLCVVDNFSDLEDPMLATCKTAGWKLLLVTRSLPRSGAGVLKVEALTDPEELRRLFEHNLGRKISPAEDEGFFRMVGLCQGHTLLLELLAAQIASGLLTMEEALSLTEQNGLSGIRTGPVSMERDSEEHFGTVRSLLQSIFRLDTLSDEERSGLRILALFTADSVKADFLRSITGAESLSVFSALARHGWARREGDTFSLHPLIRELVLSLPASEADRAAATAALRRLGEELSCGVSSETIIASTEQSPGLLRRLSSARGKRTSPSDPLPPEPFSKPESSAASGKPDRAALRSLTDLARGTAAACRRDPLLLSSPELTELRLVAVRTTSSDREEQRLADIAALLADGDRGSIILGGACRAELLGYRAEILANRGDLDGAFATVDELRAVTRRTADHRAHAICHQTAANVLDCRNAGPEDMEGFLREMNAAVRHMRKVPESPTRQLQLCTLLESIAIMGCRTGMVSEENLKKILNEAEQLVTEYADRNSECSYGMSMAIAWLAAEVAKNESLVEKCLPMAESIAKEISDSDLDFIERIIIPFGFMYFELGSTQKAAALLRRGIELCDAFPEAEPFRRMRAELADHLREVTEHASGHPEELSSAPRSENALPE